MLFKFVCQRLCNKSMDTALQLDNIRSKTRQMFKHCGKREIAADPGVKGLPVTKLITEVDRWNSTYEMLQRFYEQSGSCSDHSAHRFASTDCK